MRRLVWTAGLALLAAAVGCKDPAFFLDWPVKGMRDDARAMYDQRRYTEAAHQYEGALRRSPRNPQLEADLHVSAGQAWLAEGAEQTRAGRTADAILPLDRAITHFRQAADIEPNSQACYDGAAAVYRLQGRPDTAQQVLAARRIPRRMSLDEPSTVRPAESLRPE